MKKQQKAKVKAYYVPTSIQRLFSYSIGIVLLTQILIIGVPIIFQASSGSDFKPQLGFLVTTTLIPVFIFLIAYAMNPRKLALLSRVFESIVITLAAYVVWTVLNMVLPVLLLGNVDLFNFIYYQYLMAGLLVISFTITLWVLKRQGVWQ